MHLKLGLAQIYPKLGDRQANLDKHLAVIEQAITKHLGYEHQMLTGLTPREQTQLARLLGKLEASIVLALRPAGDGSASS